VRREHYQLSGEIALWSTANALKIRQTFELHCEGKPFEVNTPIKSLVSSAIGSDEAKQDILQFTQKGQNLNALSNWMEKAKVGYV